MIYESDECSNPMLGSGQWEQDTNQTLMSIILILLLLTPLPAWPNSVVGLLPQWRLVLALLVQIGLT